MFIMHMPATFRIGDRAPGRINGEPATLHWRDAHTLVINDTDARQIVALERGGLDGAGRPIVTFTCGDASRCDSCGQERARTVIAGDQRLCEDCFYRLRDVPKR